MNFGAFCRENMNCLESGRATLLGLCQRSANRLPHASWPLPATKDPAQNSSDCSQANPAMPSCPEDGRLRQRVAKGLPVHQETFHTVIYDFKERMQSRRD